jgi:hypothetical protein
LGDPPSPTVEYSEQQIENLKDLYEDFAEEFLDEVFGYESKMERQDWEKEVAQKQSIIFDPNKIREELKR